VACDGQLVTRYVYSDGRWWPLRYGAGGGWRPPFTMRRRARRWAWRRLPHRHQPCHPGRFTLWYCARCDLAMCADGLVADQADPDWWTPYLPHVNSDGRGTALAAALGIAELAVQEGRLARLPPH
jgi:hypothetical protein